MKPKIITGEEVVGWYCFLGTIAPKQFNTLTQEEQEDYLTEDDKRKYIYIQFSEFVDDDLELYFSKNDLIESLINETEERILSAENEIKIIHKRILGLKSKKISYSEMLEGESK